MKKGKQPEPKIDLPKGWWLRLVDVCRELWADQKGGEARLDIYEFTRISRRSFATARVENQMTERLFARLTSELGYENHRDLLHDLKPIGRVQKATKGIPDTLSLTTQRANPQWADYGDYEVEHRVPWTLRCRIATESPYFRFGFKLLGEDERVFGDGSIQSYDANLIVHIGRNNWDRPSLGISARDIFLTSYMSGSFIEENDRCLFRSKPKLEVTLELTVDKSYSASVAINGQSHFRHVVPPAICRRVAVLAWGDREEFRVDVTDLAIASI